MSQIVARYEVQCSEADAADIARHIAVEQTVEVPDALIDATIESEIVGEVAGIEPIDATTQAITIAYAPELAHGSLPQLLNLVYGNVSLLHGARLADLELPPAVLDRFPGPNYGIAGLREKLGVPRRPLLSTALKPRGLPVAELAKIAGDFARAGGDLVKDDHNIVDDDLAAFRARVAQCQAAVDEANAATGGRCLYVANLIVGAELPTRTPFPTSPARVLSLGEYAHNRHDAGPTTCIFQARGKSGLPGPQLPGPQRQGGWHPSPGHTPPTDCLDLFLRHQTAAPCATPQSW